jgi:manganese-dependent inorganic pyrophosphatase
MRLEPVGATSTIVAKLFDEGRVPVPPPIAGVLLGAILTDTLLFRAPTTTPEDRRVAERLAKIARVEAQELGAEILRRASDVSDRTADQILNADFKEFNVDGARFGIGVIETANGEAVLSRRDELLPAMDRVRGSGYSCVLFAVIDIVRERTSILVDGCPDAAAAAFGTPLTDDRVLELPAILSRKKNIVPLLGDIAAGIKRS